MADALTTHPVPIVLLHGWGFHRDIWGDFADALRVHHPVMTLDLPGYADSPAPATPDLAGMAEVVLAQCPQPAIWLGWSLGGLLAQYLAIHHPQHVRALGLIGSSPCFMQRDDWKAAMSAKVLEQFAQQLQQDCHNTLCQFLTLQVSQDTAGRGLLRELRADFCNRPEPSSEILSLGLDLLKNVDLRPCLAQIQCPTWVCLGARDRLVPKSIEPHWHQLWTSSHNKTPPHLETHCIADAAHVPFLSHTAWCVQSFLDFLTSSAPAETP